MSDKVNSNETSLEVRRRVLVQVDAIVEEEAARQLGEIRAQREEVTLTQPRSALPLTPPPILG